MKQHSPLVFHTLSAKIFKTLLAALLSLILSSSVQPVLAANQSAAIEIIEDPQELSFVNLPTYMWRKAGSEKPAAIVVSFHGGCLHGRSFDTLARKLAEKNILFVSFDMRGYGKWYHSSYGTEAEKTFNYTRTLVDVRRLLSTFRMRNPGIPVICLGESLGANFALVVAYMMPEFVDGLILVSPYGGSRKFINGQVLRHMTQAAFHPKSELDLTPHLRERLADDPRMAQAEINDPMSRNRQSPKEFGQSVLIVRSGRRKAKSLSPDIAVLIVQGDKDLLCHPRRTAKLFNRMPTQNKEFILMPGIGHLIVEAPEIRDEVTEKLAGWIIRQSDRSLTAVRTNAALDSAPQVDQASQTPARTSP